MPIDYSNYPANWQTEIVPRILKRAEYRCEICGLKNKQIVYTISIYMKVKETGRYGFRSIWVRNKQDALKIEPLGKMETVRVILAVAHLDHGETNNDVSDDRLKALCQKCHLGYDAEEKMRRIMLKGR